mgnify:CR=1 FL=1
MRAIRFVSAGFILLVWGLSFAPDTFAQEWIEYINRELRLVDAELSNHRSIDEDARTNRY